MSPYVVTTKRRGHERPVEFVSREVLSQRAVATLGEAQRKTVAALMLMAPDVAYDHLRDDARKLPESGGTVGPLPDGTVIEVECVEWETLAADFDTRDRMAEVGSWSQDSLLAAFNAQEVTR